MGIFEIATVPTQGLVVNTCSVISRNIPLIQHHLEMLVVLCFAGWLSECTASHTAQNNTLRCLLIVSTKIRGGGGGLHLAGINFSYFHGPEGDFSNLF